MRFGRKSMVTTAAQITNWKAYWLSWELTQKSLHGDPKTYIQCLKHSWDISELVIGNDATQHDANFSNLGKQNCIATTLWLLQRINGQRLAQGHCFTDSHSALDVSTSVFHIEQFSQITLFQAWITQFLVHMYNICIWKLLNTSICYV